MKAILADDRIVSISNDHGVEVGNPPNKPFDLGRLRYSFVQKRLLDLIDYDHYFVENNNSNFILHIEQLKKSWQPVKMAYKDKKKLVNIGGKIQLEPVEIAELKKQKELKYRSEVQARRKVDKIKLAKDLNKLKDNHVSM